MKTTRLLSVMLILLLAMASAFASGEKETGQAAAAESGGGKIVLYATLAEYEKETGKQIKSFGEAPMLADLVKAGQLPPVEQRIPDEPMVVAPQDRIGKYGGTLRGAATGPTTGGHDLHTARFQPLLRLSPEMKIVPNIAKGFELANDNKDLTVYLRKGMKWSDGQPFTAEDIMFWLEDRIMNDELNPVKPKPWRPGGKLVEIDRIDDYTVRFRFAVPYPPITGRLAVSGSEPFDPKHYLQQWHIKYNPKANELAVKEGHENWWQAFNFHRETNQQQQDPDLPLLSTWVLQSIDSYGNKHFERNPYFYMIDTAGNQLPYIDKQTRVLVESREVVNLKAVGGEFDYVGLHMSLDNYTVYKEGEAQGDYHIMLFDNVWGNEYIFAFNYNSKDPVKNEIFNDLRFRQAVSLAINRQEISDTLYYGKAVPWQATTPPNTSFFEPWMGTHYAEYDPDKANQLLDEMGLQWDGNEQWRLRPDGKPLTVLLEYVDGEGPKGKVSEFLKEYWAELGINLSIKMVQRNFYQERGKANERDMGVWHYGQTTEFAAYINPVKLSPPWSGYGNPLSGSEWWNWYNTGGEQGEKPPAEVIRLLDVVFEWQTKAPGTPEYLALGKEMLTINLENLYVLGTVGQAPKPILIKNKLENTPQDGMFGWDYRFFFPFMAEQWYYE